jgi:hypothetical protein
MENTEKLRVYESVRGYTIKALHKAIKELKESISGPINEQVVEVLKSRKNELEKTLEKIESFLD